MNIDLQRFSPMRRDSGVLWVRAPVMAASTNTSLHCAKAIGLGAQIDGEAFDRGQPQIGPGGSTPGRGASSVVSANRSGH